jgi:acetyltransferase-like isoleucine patch superfamily enzyme
MFQKKISFIKLTLWSLVKGFFIKLCYMNFKGVLLLGEGSSFNNPRTIVMSGLVRLGRFSEICSYTRHGIKLGNNFSVGSFSVIKNGFNHFSKFGSLTIGENVGLGDYCFICAVSNVTIGSNTIVGQYLSVHPQNHNYKARDRLNQASRYDTIWY